MNNITEDDNSPTITEFYVNHYEANPLFDDLKDGFANAYFNEISVNIDRSVDKLALDTECELTALVQKADKTIEAELIWSSSNEDVISIVDNKLITKKVGTAIITATLETDDRIKDSISIEVVEDVVDDVYELDITPDTMFVLQRTTKQFNVSLYKNGVKQEKDIVIRNVTTDVPTEYYEITGGLDNTFTIENKKMFLDFPILVECSCDEITQVFEITLRGLY